MAYSAGTAERLVPVGTIVKFPSSTNYLVAKPELVALMRESIGPDVQPLRGNNVPAKRICTRPLETGGEQAEEQEDRRKGGSGRCEETDQK